MLSIELKKTTHKKASCAGIGLVSLDVVMNGSPLATPRLSTGGTCGNILLILAYLGWKAHPIARLKPNTSSDIIIEEFKNFAADLTGITLSEDGSTPIIIHRVLKDKLGAPKHHFEFRNPVTKQYLPSFKAVVGKAVDELVNGLPTPKVLIVDRATRSSIELAKRFGEKGTLVFFEPSSITEERLFLEMMDHVHIVKFSSERIQTYHNYFPKRKALLELETCGSKGIRFRSYKSRKDEWKEQPAFAVETVVDSAGAGDWCSAGVLHSLAQDGLEGFKILTQKDIEISVKLGQALGGANCEHLGARGMMQNFTFQELRDRVNTGLSPKMARKVHAANVLKLSSQTFDFGTLL